MKIPRKAAFSALVFPFLNIDGVLFSHVSMAAIVFVHPGLCFLYALGQPVHLARVLSRT